MITTTLLAASLPATGTLLGILFYVAILAVFIWALFAITSSAGVTIHPVVKIILIAILSIVAILFLARICGVPIT